MSKKKKNKKRTRTMTPAALAANRANAQKSTGPRSKEGKVESAKNSTDHGGYTGQYLLPGEDPNEFEEHRQGLLHSLNPPPDDMLAMEYCSSFIWTCWFIRRIFRQITRAQMDLVDDIVAMNREVDRLTKVLQRLERSRDKARKLYEEYRQTAATRHREQFNQQLREALSMTALADNPADHFKAVQAQVEALEKHRHESANGLSQADFDPDKTEVLGSFRAPDSGDSSQEISMENPVNVSPSPDCERGEPPFTNGSNDPSFRAPDPGNGKHPAEPGQGPPVPDSFSPPPGQ